MTALINAAAHILTALMETIAAKTATFNGTAFDTQDYEGSLAILQVVGAVTGTTTTLDGKIQSSDTSGGTYADVPGATFTQVSDTGDNQVQKIAIDLNGCKRWIRYVGTIAGTTPSYTMAVVAAGVKKY